MHISVSSLSRIHREGNKRKNRHPAR